MVDVISEGRLKLGVGLGNFPSEFEFFGLNPKTQVSRFEESIEILQKLWAGETLDHSGKHFTVKGNLTRSHRTPSYGWARCPSPASAAPRASAALAHRPAAQHRGHEGVEGQLRAAGEEYGTTDKLQMVLLRDGWVADSMDDVERDWWP